MSNELVDLIARKFIARRDVKASQNNQGSYSPVVDGRSGERLPWTRQDVVDHLSGKKTFGHYLLDEDSMCKLFAFDIDLEKTKLDDRDNIIWQGKYPDPFAFDGADKFSGEIIDFNPREAWRDRAHPSRAWTKYQLHLVAHQLLKGIEALGVPGAVAYTGAKGLHVYGFTGLINASDAREGAEIVLDTLSSFAGGVAPIRGKSFFKFKNDDPIDGFPNLSIEVFPKQTSLDGKDLGNLMRLPLGRNRKTADPTFFVDMSDALTSLNPVDPMHALTTDSQWRRRGE